MKKIVVALVAVSLLFSCIDSDDSCDNGQIPIVMTSKIVVSERSSQQDVQLVRDQKVGFFVTKYDDPGDVPYSNILLVADGNGFFDAQGVSMFYPTEPEFVNFYAMHPYNAAASISQAVSTPVSVNVDQSVLKNYYDSDLLYARKERLEKTRLPVPLVFNHKFSKFTFVVKQGSGIDLTGLTSITIMNVFNESAMFAYDGALFPASGIETEINVYGVKGTSVGETEVSGMAAIIIPQDFGQSGAKQLFKVVINGAEYFYTPPTVLNFEEGKVYNFVLTVSGTGIEVTSSIENWYPGGEIIEEITR